MVPNFLDTCAGVHCLYLWYVLHFCSVFQMTMEIQLLELRGHCHLLCETDTRFCMYD